MPPTYEDLTGRTTDAGLQIQRKAPGLPIRWCVRCSNCGSQWTERHQVVRTVACRNAACGKAPSECDSRVPTFVSSTPLARNADRETRFHNSRDSRAYKASDAAIADPDAIRHYLDYVEARKENR